MTSPGRILQNCPQALEECANLLREDKLVAVPTETVYGLAGNALSENAVRKIFNVKGRPLIDPLITHFKDAKEAFSYVHGSEQAEVLASAFWPGPLTLVLHKMPIIPDLVTAGLNSAAIRVPREPIMQSLLQKLDFPLAAPSANPFGYVSPTRPEHVARTLGSKIAAILDGGICQHGVESTVLDLRNPRKVQILRPGPVCAEQIEERLGCRIDTVGSSNSTEAQSSPGQLSKHYSPNTEIVIVKHGHLALTPGDDEVIIANKKPDSLERGNVYWLSEDGNLDTITRNFFDLIQKLDRLGYKRMIIEAASNQGIGIALNDRLRRAASK